MHCPAPRSRLSPASLGNPTANELKIQLRILILLAVVCGTGCGMRSLSTQEPDSGGRGAIDSGGGVHPGDGGGGSGVGGGGVDAGNGVDAGSGLDAGVDAGAPLQVCACWLSNGDYCGQIAIDHAATSNCAIPAAAGNGTNLMNCSNGTWSVKQVCAAGCTFRPRPVKPSWSRS